MNCTRRSSSQIADKNENASNLTSEERALHVPGTVLSEKKKCFDELMRMEFVLEKKLNSLSLSGHKSEIRSLLASIGTDLTKNDNDPYGNGDQSRIDTTESRSKAFELFSIAGDIHKHGMTNSFSPLGLACLSGSVAKAQKIVDDTCQGTISQPYSTSMELTKLLESRETSMRVSPLLLLVSMTLPCLNPIDQARAAKILLKAGASPDCKDVLGKTVVHYGAGSTATNLTMEVVDMCIRAAESSDLYGQDVELVGLKSKDMNGCQGIAGGFDPDTDRRTVYIPKLKKEVWAKPINIRLLGGTTTKDKPMLADVQDRLGSVSLHEVVMSDRLDVAEFLLTKHKTSIHTKDLNDISPLIMTTMMSTQVSKMISDVTRHQAKMDRDAKKEARKTCTYCRKDLDSSGGMKCGKCLVTFYCGQDCQVAHWKEAHKKECKELQASTSGVKLSTPDGFIASFSFSTGITTRSKSSYRNPRGVKVGDKFVIKVQGGSHIDSLMIKVQGGSLMIYDESRTCEFQVLPDASGFQEILKAVNEEPAWGGRTTFMKASFDSSGDCTVYPATAGVKNKYSW